MDNYTEDNFFSQHTAEVITKFRRDLDLLIDLLTNKFVGLQISK